MLDYGNHDNIPDPYGIIPALDPNSVTDLKCGEGFRQGQVQEVW